jgi:phage regulator Rha-like protein
MRKEYTNNNSHLLIDEAFEQAKKIKGWDKYITINYMAQRVRMLGVNGQNYSKDRHINDPLVKTTSLSMSDIVIEEVAAGKFYEVKA